MLLSFCMCRKKKGMNTIKVFSFLSKLNKKIHEKSKFYFKYGDLIDL